ncbi:MULTISPECIES: hypothetical protein [Paenibacillus]|uniref:hypothetical protein n=1 Tax=Paenibacillus TaxID=44249 RepID=UPI0022B882F5|nr:hypothetical protein [Paenibacillus caseinilyticus]
MLRKEHIPRLLICLTASTCLLAGCGKAQEQQGGAKAQSAPQESKPPIDTELQQHMKMYQELKKQENEQAVKRREAEKKTLEKLQKEREKTMLRELQYEDKVLKGGNPWKTQNKKDSQKEEGKEEDGKKKEKGEEKGEEGGSGQSSENQGGGSGS